MINNKSIKQIFLFSLFLLFFNNEFYAQYFKKGEDSLGQIESNLNLFSINDSTKYFEFFTSEMIHGDLECGILSKVSDSLYKIKYADGANFKPFNLVIKSKSVEIVNMESNGFKANNLKGIFYLHDSFVKQNAYTFPLNYKVFIKAKKNIKIKAYEFPNSNSKFKMIFIKQGEIIEKKWTVGSYPNIKSIDPIENEAWSICVYNGTKHDWILLSDIYNLFDIVRNKK